MNVIEKVMVYAVIGGLATYAVLHKFGSAPATKKLDANLTPEEADAVRIALVQEDSAANLRSFAASMEPDYPIAVAALRSKADSLSPGAAQ